MVGRRLSVAIQGLRRHLSWFGHPYHRGELLEPFFVIGSGRSGTTLLRRVLTGGEGVHVPPETYVLGQVIRDFRRLRGHEWDLVVTAILGRFEYHPEFRHFGVTLGPLARRLADLDADQRSLAAVLDGFYRFHGEQTGVDVQRWGDKTPWNTFNLHAIDRVFPRARYVHVVRDAPDVVASYLNMERYREVADAAERWVRSVRAADRFGDRHPDRYLVVRYEDLVQDVEPQVERVCAFLDLEFEPGMLASEPRTAQLGDVAELDHHRGVDRPIHADSVGRGRRELSPAQLEVVEQVAGDQMRRLGYEHCG